MVEPEPRLRPPETRGHVSVARLHDYWYVACRSRELRGKPLRRVLLGIPLVLFRDRASAVGALLDRCPHRNVPLSQGRVLDGGRLQCGYHGWEFDVTGACRHVPGLVGPGEAKGRRAPAHAVRERDGFVWVFGAPDTEPTTDPLPLPLGTQRGYTTVVEELVAEATVHATAENALDVPHTAYLHRGLFRGTRREPVTLDVEVRRWRDRVEAEYIGEPRPPGLVGRLLSPSGGVVQHWDRFILPSVAQVEYRLGQENHVVVTTAMSPVTDFVTRLFAVISFRLRVPSALIKPLLRPLALRIFRQDADILRIQSRTIRQFGGEQFMSTEIDVLGREIWRLLRQAERGDTDGSGEEPSVRRLQLIV